MEDDGIVGEGHLLAEAELSATELVAFEARLKQRPAEDDIPELRV